MLIIVVAAKVYIRRAKEKLIMIIESSSSNKKTIDTRQSSLGRDNANARKTHDIDECGTLRHHHSFPISFIILFITSNRF